LVNFAEQEICISRNPYQTKRWSHVLSPGVCFELGVETTNFLKLHLSGKDIINE